MRRAQLIVRESQTAQFVYLGQFGDTFGPGKYSLTTDNIPILSTLKGWKYGFQSPFKADVYYVITRLFTGNKWGTSNPVMMRDQDFGIVRVRAFGTYDFKIVDRLVTNFHPSESPVLMMVSAFAGRERLLKGYKHAIKGGYRFYSYGDAMLIL